MSFNPEMWAAAAREEWKCPKCKGTGVIETGNNDLPCDCLAGDAALFNNAFASGGPVTGAEVKRHFLNTSPEPIVNTVSVEDLRKGNFSVAPRVLVVDDDDDENLRYVTGVLVMAGYGVVQAHDGLEGLRTFREDNVGFSLVLSDWSMPNMIGFHAYPDEKQKPIKATCRVYLRQITSVGNQGGNNYPVVVAQEMYVPSKPDGWPPTEKS
jgi:CheY-like chemotaxis protein